MSTKSEQDSLTRVIFFPEYHVQSKFWELLRFIKAQLASPNQQSGDNNSVSLVTMYFWPLGQVQIMTTDRIHCHSLLVICKASQYIRLIS